MTRWSVLPYSQRITDSSLRSLCVYVCVYRYTCFLPLSKKYRSKNKLIVEFGLISLVDQCNKDRFKLTKHDKCLAIIDLLTFWQKHHCVN